MGGEPLFLAMFGLVAGRQEVGEASSLTSDRIAQDLAREERDRIMKHWQADAQLPQAVDRPLAPHLVALASLSDGWTDAEARAAIKQEAAALDIVLPGGAEPARAALAAALPGDQGGVAPGLPDILGEALAILALRILPDKGVAALGRVPEAKRAQMRSSARLAVGQQRDALVQRKPIPL